MDQLASLRQIDRSRDIDGQSVRLYFWSRSPAVLCSFAAVVLAIGLAAAWLVRSHEVSADEPRAKALRAELAKPAPDMAKVIAWMGGGAAELTGTEEGQEWIAKSKLAPADKVVAAAFWDSITNWPVEPSADLLYFAHYVNPMRHANELVGDLHFSQKNTDAAITYYEREARFPEAKTARQKLFELLLAKGDYAGAHRLADDPAIGPKLTPQQRLLLAAGERRWRDVLQPMLEMEKEHLQPMPLGLAALAGLVWLIIALQAIQPPRIPSFRVIVPILAVVAGMVSVIPTLYALLWEEEVWQLRQTGELLDDFVFYIAGVGPREELCKLLLFLPFVPVLLLRKSRLEMLVVAGCVGLGFGIAENLQYFAQAGPAIAFGRFLTANFFHFAATGIIGLAFCDWLRAPVKQALPFIARTLGVMLAHGFYDAFMAVSELQALILVSMMSFMLLSLFFFRTLRALRDPATDQISIAGTLIVGISILNAAVLVCASAQLGFFPAIACLGFIAFSLIMITYMFYWQLGEGMSHAAAEELSSARPFATA